MPDGDLRAFTHFGLQPVAQGTYRLIEVLGVDYDLDQARQIVTSSHGVLDQIAQRIDEEERQDGAR